MLSVARDYISKRSHGNSEGVELKPVTLVFWADFMSNPSIFYGLFAPTPRKLNYDPDRVKVLGTNEGMINQINVHSLEDLDAIHEELLGAPLLMRVWVEHIQNTYTGAQPQTEVRWEGDMAMLIDTSHPMICPELERGLEVARKTMQSGGSFCIQIDFSQAVERWLRRAFPRGCCTVGNVRTHRASLFITNYGKPQQCFRCNALWCILFGPCWILSAPCYKLYRRAKVKDIRIAPLTQIVRRAILPSGKIVEVKK